MMKIITSSIFTIFEKDIPLGKAWSKKVVASLDEFGHLLGTKFKVYKSSSCWKANTPVNASSR